MWECIQKDVEPFDSVIRKYRAAVMKSNPDTQNIETHFVFDPYAEDRDWLVCDGLHRCTIVSTKWLKEHKALLITGRALIKLRGIPARVLMVDEKVLCILYNTPPSTHTSTHTHTYTHSTTPHPKKNNQIHTHCVCVCVCVCRLIFK